MANREQKSSREKKKPKAEKNKVKQQAPAAGFAAIRTPAVVTSGQAAKKSV